MPWWIREPTTQRDPAAIEARRRAERELEARRAEGTRARDLVAWWRRIQDENHLAPAINATFRGEK